MLVDGRTRQAGLFSAALTAFIIDRYQNIQRTPSQQAAYFQQQSAVLLNQISHQLSSLGAQYPSDLSLPGPPLSPSGSDVRVNIYWFSSLVFSLSAALLATLVQRWARNHMHIFQRYSHPLKIARIRQYLYEGVERWHMLASAEAVPGLIHISLFLFFIGLADFLLSTYPIVGKFTIFPISLCVTLYIFSTVAPIINPQSPYRTSFSRFVWYFVRKLHKRWYKDSSGVPKPLSSNMADGQMQLAMEKNDERKGRDERAIRWLVNNLTEDIEMESLASGIPGSFDAKWGMEVWKTYPGIKREESTTSDFTEPAPALPGDNNSDPPPPLPMRHSTLGSLFSHVNNLFNMQHPGDSLPRTNPKRSSLPLSGISPNSILPPSRTLSARGGEVIDDLCLRIQRLFETCNHRDSFLNQDEWRRRSRACVETAASFVFCMDAEIRLFGNIGKLLSDLGSAERTREVSPTSLNWSFISRWTCLSIVLIRKLLDSRQLRENASGAILILGTLYDADNFTPAETAPENARKMDEQFVAAWECVERLRREFDGLGEGDRRRGKVEEILVRYKPELEQIQAEAVQMKPVDECISGFRNQIDQVTHNLIRHLPGIAFDELTGPTPLGQVFDFLASPVHPQLLHLSPRLLGLCSLSQKRSSGGYIETTEVLKTVEKIPVSMRLVVHQHRLMERQLWRLEDISAGAFGFTLELYFLSLRQILSTSMFQPREIHVLFYTNAFKVITSDWDQFKGSRGTLQIILNLVCDIAVRDRGIFSNCEYPSYIKKELLKLLDNMVKGQANSYIDDAMAELRDLEWRTGDKEFRDCALKIIEGHRPRRPD